MIIVQPIERKTCGKSIMLVWFPGIHSLELSFIRQNSQNAHIWPLIAIVILSEKKSVMPFRSMGIRAKWYQNVPNKGPISR